MGSKEMQSSVITINRNGEFHRIYSKGTYMVSPVLVTYYMKNKKKNLKYGITASKKVGIAVKRNRARRLIKTAFTELEPQIKRGYSIIFVARQKTGNVKMQDVKQSMKQHLYRAGLINEKRNDERDNAE